MHAEKTVRPLFSCPETFRGGVSEWNGPKETLEVAQPRIELGPAAILQICLQSMSVDKFRH
jgi:hypothetical protein